MQKKVTLSLDAALVQQVQKLVQQGEAKSQSQFFEAALRAKLRQIERARWRQEMLEASRDPLFLADLEDIERDFAYADAESARLIE